jgi:hypothetical protein
MDIDRIKLFGTGAVQPVYCEYYEIEIKIKLFFFGSRITVFKLFFTNFLRKKFKISSSSQAIWYGSRATGCDFKTLYKDDLEI